MSTAASSQSAASGQSPGLKTYFKSPEGRYKLLREKVFPLDVVANDNHNKSANEVRIKIATQGTLADLKDKPMQASSQSSTLGVSSGVRFAAARFLSGGNGNKSHGIGVNGGSKSMNSRIGSLGSSYNYAGTSRIDARGTYLVFNVGDAIFISDLNSPDKDPIKCIHFSNLNPVCHAYDPEVKDGHDLIIGLNSGDVYSMSLRQQLQDPGRKAVGAQHYNKDGYIDNSSCTCITWIPNGDGSFIVAHADGNMFVYEKNKDIASDPSFSLIKDPAEFSVSHMRHSKNPVTRWHISQGSINDIAFSPDCSYMATVGRDGYLRVFDYKNEQLMCGGKSYYGSLLCCAWSMDGKYILAGGEDDLVLVWSMEDRKIVAWGEGHNSWVSGVAFDSYWVAPNPDTVGENIVYRFGSVGQDGRLLLWDLEMDELVVPVRRPPGGSPTFSTGSQSPPWDGASPVGTLQPAPRIRDVPKLSPLLAHRVDNEPLTGLVFTQEYVLTVGRDRHAKIWMRPDLVENQSTNTDSNFH